MKNQRTLSPVDIIKLSHDGRGIAYIDGKTTFVRGALASEQVSIQYTRSHSRYDEAIVTAILKASADRVEPKCTSFDICGGCSMQHMNSKAQILAKQQSLLEQFEQIAKITPDNILSPLTADVWGYRRKARLGVRYVIKKERVLVGFREKINPRFLAEIEQCEVLDPRVGKNINALKTLITSLDAKQSIAQIEVAISDEVVALIFRNLEPLNPHDMTQLNEFGKQCHFHIYLQPSNADSIYRIYPDINPNDDNCQLLSYRLTAFDLHMHFHPADFTQINDEINQQMVAKAIELLMLDANDNVLDLFCGLGNFSLAAAKSCRSVTGIEGSERMVKRAHYNAQFNALENTQFFSANLEEIKDYPWLRQNNEQRYNKLIIDPPRSGALSIIQQLANHHFERIVYISCNPATLARDAAELIKQGYRLTHAGVMDMFPHTAHVESIALFEKTSW